MATTKSEVSLLLTAKDSATRVVKTAAKAVDDTAKQVTKSAGDITKTAELAAAALRKMGVAEKDIEKALERMGLSLKANAAGMKDSTVATQSLGTESAKAAQGIHAMALALGGDTSALDKWKASVKNANTEVHGLTAGLAGNSTAFQTWRASVQNATGAVHPMAAAMGVAAKETRGMGQGLLILKNQSAEAAKEAERLAKSSTNLKDAFRALAAEIPFLNRGLDLAKSFFTSLPGILTAVGAGLALVAIQAARMADRVQQGLLVIRNQLPGVNRDLKGLQDIIKRVADQDAFGRTQAEITEIGKVLARNGTPNAEEFERRLRLVTQAANASGEAAEGLAEGIDLISDAFQLDGRELEETFAKIVVAANGLVPLPDLFQALGRGSAHLEAFGVDAETAARAVASFADAGIPGREAGTALVRVLENLMEVQRGETEQAIRSGRAFQALGIDLKKLKEEGATLPQILQLIQERTAGSVEALDAMGFTAKEATAIIRGDFREGVLSGEDALKKLKEQSDGVGDSVAAQSRKLRESFSAELIKLGNEILPPVIALMKEFNSLFKTEGESPFLKAVKRELVDIARLLDILLTQGRSGPNSPFGEGPLGQMLQALGIIEKKQKDVINNWDKLQGLDDFVKNVEGTGSRAKNTAIRDEAFDADAAEAKETAEERAARLARAAADRDKIEERFKKQLEEQITLIETKIKMGRDEVEDRTKLDTLEASIREQLEAQNISTDRRVTLEQALGRIIEVRQSIFARELESIQARAELGKTTSADATRLNEIYEDLRLKLQDQKLTITEQLALYQQMLAVLQLMEKVKLPGIGSNLGPQTDSTRQGASAGEEQALRDAANGTGRTGGGLITGTEGAGPSPRTEARAKAAQEAIEGAKDATDEFNQALNNAVAGPLADFFQKLTEGFTDLKDVALNALEAIADAIIGVASQEAAQGILGLLNPTKKTTNPLLEGAEGEEALERAEAQKETRVAAEVTVEAAKAEVNAPVATAGAEGATADITGIVEGEFEPGVEGVEAGGEALEKSALNLGSVVPLLGAAAIALQGVSQGKFGGLLGGIAGFLIGGPMGAMLGSSFGSMLPFKDGGVAESSFFHGIVTGPGGPKDDKILARLSNGEGILTAETTHAMGGRPAIQRLNKLGRNAPRFATGGVVEDPKKKLKDVPAYAQGGVIGDIISHASTLITHESAETYLQQIAPVTMNLPKFADGGVAGAAVEPGRAEVTLTLPEGVKGDVKSDDDVVRVIVKNRRALRDLFADN